jgi:hypothetical protein
VTGGQIDLSHQLQVINLGYLGRESNIFELASTYVDFSILPLFNDFKSKSAQKDAGNQDANQVQGLDAILKELN